MLTLEKISKLKQSGRTVICPVPLYQTSDGRIVGADDPDRRWKYCGVGQEILESALAEFRSGSEPDPPKAKKAKPKKGKGKGGKKVAKPEVQEAEVNREAETKEAVPETKEAKLETKASQSRKKRPREGQQE